MDSYVISKTYPHRVVANYEIEESNILEDRFGNPIEFQIEKYSHLRCEDRICRKDSIDTLCFKLANYICNVLNNSEEGKLNEFREYSDVRYRVYWSRRKRIFISVCVQDFDLDDYYEENFVTGEDEIIEFYRNKLSNLGGKSYDSDELAMELCDIICNYLNNYWRRN